MDFPAYAAELPREQQLDLRVDIFHIVFEDEIPGLHGDENPIESFGERLPFRRRKQSDAFQHPDMRLGPLDVISGKPQVQHPVVPDRERIHDLRGISSFIP
jgi:hypothetical protein